MKFYVFKLYRGVVSEIHPYSEKTLAIMKFGALCEEGGKLDVSQEDFRTGFVRLNTLSAVQLLVVKEEE